MDLNYRILLKEKIQFWKFCQYQFYQQWNDVKTYANEKGIYIISSHDIECLQNVCDKCLLLHNGQIREINTEEVDREKIAKILSEGE